MKKHWVYFIILLTLIPIHGISRINSNQFEIEYLIDEHRDIPVDSLIYGGFIKKMIPIDGDMPNLGFLDGGLWLKIAFDQNADFQKNVIMELKNPNLDLILVYEVIHGKIFLHNISGDQLSYKTREVKHRYFQYPLIHQIHHLDYILIYVDNIGDQLFIPIEFSDKTSIDKRDYFLQYTNGLYFGILLFVLLLNLFMYFSLREKSNLHYLFYILGLILLQLSLEGYAFENIWPNSPYWANHANPIFASFSVLFLLLFCREFLSMKESLPRLDKIFKIIAVILVINLVFSSLNIQWMYKASILVINVIALVLNLMIIPIGLYLWHKGYKAARFFVPAFILLVIGVFFFILRNFGILPSNIITEKSLQVGSAFEVILLTLAIVDRFKFFKEQSLVQLQEIADMKSRANVELEIKVDERTKQLKEQKEIVEHKNKEITESIVYAKRIQNGLLPSPKLFEDMHPDSFYVYFPKDIVSGDFYWIDEIDSKTYFAAVDCTGHGVPGAMVSVMGFNHLNRCIHEHGLRKPNEILDKLTELMIASFDKSELTIYDGMDIALCCLDRNKETLEYAGAYNPLYIISKNELSETKATKQAIGFNEHILPFQNHEFKVSKNDWVYVFSDGFPDQFGGPKGKKYKYKEFKQLLLDLSSLPAKEQQSEIEKSFRDWMGELDQIDDVCILGIKV